MLPFDLGPQGDKIPAPIPEQGNVPQAVPFTVAQIGDRLLATVPGEPTVGAGKLLRDSVAAAVSGSGIHRVVIVGYVGEYLDYFTTPAEYERQHYEGGSTLYGHYATLVLRDSLTRLARRLVTGLPAPSPYPFDPNHGVHVGIVNYGPGADNGSAAAQPTAVRRLQRATFSWTGGPNGIDRPVDRAYVTIQHSTARGWRSVADDLGLEILWSADARGNYAAQWEVPLSASVGAYRFIVTANQYRLVSASFDVTPSTSLAPTRAGAVVRLGYPAAVTNVDITYRPPYASGGSITFLVDGRRLIVRARAAAEFPIPAGTTVSIPAGGARDPYSNTNAQAMAVK
jgi:hypothetical protein